jgi:RNA polymerase sigma factor (sigma-70 family)
MNKERFDILILSLRKGEMALLESIYKENRLPFLKFATNFNISNEEVLDIYQDAILALRDNLVNGVVPELNCTLKTYLFSIGKFMIYKRYKDLKKINSSPVDQTVDVSYDFPYYNENHNDELQQKIEVHFEKLGEKCRQVLKLFYYDGLTLQEIQEYFNYDNYNVVKSQKSRCLKSLKDLINKNENDRERATYR